MAWVLSLCLLSACAPHVERVSLPGLPPLEEGPHDDPGRDAQVRLLREAYRAMAQARYQTAVLFFRRFIDGSPDSPHLMEARWWLGRAHEQLGDYRSAMAQYRIVASGQLAVQYHGAEYAGYALQRLDELRQVHADPLAGAEQVALRLGAHYLPPTPALTQWLEDMARGGVTALIIETANSASRAMLSRERLREIVIEAHRVGLFIWVSLDVHEPQGWNGKEDWLSQKVDRGTRERVPVARPDSANPDYRAALEEKVKEFSGSGYDGLFFPARRDPGFAEEFSDGSFSTFASSFGLEISPQQVFGSDTSVDAPAQDKTALYWRWVGWKARAYAKLLTRLRSALREHQPTAGLLLEVHQTTLTAPLAGLQHYGEEIADLAQQTGGSLVVLRDSEDGSGPIDKLGQQLGNVERLWVEIVTSMAALPPSAAALQRAIADTRDHAGRPLVILPQLAPAVP